MDFPSLLDGMSATIASRDGQGFAALFTPEAVYEDYFYGPHRGRDEILAMFDKFFDGGDAFCWQFHEPLHDGDLAYARYWFSFRSTQADNEGRLVALDGMARFRLADGLIGHYTECFDRGSALAALGYPETRTIRILSRYAEALVAGEAGMAHLEYRAACGAA